MINFFLIFIFSLFLSLSTFADEVNNEINRDHFIVVLKTNLNSVFKTTVKDTESTQGVESLNSVSLNYNIKASKVAYFQLGVGLGQLKLNSDKAQKIEGLSDKMTQTKIYLGLARHFKKNNTFYLGMAVNKIVQDSEDDFDYGISAEIGYRYTFKNNYLINLSYATSEAAYETMINSQKETVDTRLESFEIGVGYRF